MNNNFKHLDINDIPLLKKFCHSHQPLISEINAVNLFIWKDYYNYCWKILNDHLILIGKKTGGTYFSLQPIGLHCSNKKILRMISDVFKYDFNEPAVKITRVEKRFAADLNAEANYSVKPLREHFDYVYLIDKTINLQGKKFENKRNEINKFSRYISNHELFIDNVKEKYFDSYLAISKKWSEENKSQDNKQIEAEYKAISNALSNAHSLNFTGTTIIIDGKVEGFTICDMLNQNTALIHIQKYNRSIPGLCVFLTIKTLKSCYNNIKYFNYEQDLGILGLQFSKLSYRPIFLEEKYELTNFF
ncbi:DUF2156 domain-containing protein [Candidatus Dependentiae bacterium]|nr:DUF2156 domain-containing protein [Candidatus Dependentiae bacterium]